MCTAVTMQSRQQEVFLGRTMDFSHELEPRIYVTPRNFVWSSAFNSQRFHDYYGIIGVGQKTEGIMGYFDGVNEKGFAAAALYFSGYAEYEQPGRQGAKTPVAALDFVHYILGKCASVAELEELLPQISLMGVPDPVTRTPAPLHWIATDRSGACVVVERTIQGTRLYENPIGVLANSPDFPWHITNLRNYLGVTPEQPSEAIWGNIRLRPFGQGAGSMLLPGGYTPPERFARMAYLKTHVVTPHDSSTAVLTGFQLLESVSIAPGVVVTDRGTYDDTKYVMFLNVNTCECFFKSYQNSQITSASLWEYMGSGGDQVCLNPLIRPVTFGAMKPCDM